MNYLLVVEDNPKDRSRIRALLEKELNLCVESAANGIEALEQLESATPLVVISDLHMPEMDGLSLVKIMRRKFPTIPVILMTALGSEEIAVEALVEGAAEYVSKQHLTEDLIPAVRNMLNLAACNVSHQRITGFLQYKLLKYRMRGDLALIPALVDQLQQSVAAMRVVPESDRIRLARCLSEAARNAVLHGGANADAHLDVIAELTPEEARFTFRDHGPGYNQDAFLDPRRAPERLHAQGRGLNLIHLFMDEVSMNDGGNEVTLVKRRRKTAHSTENFPAETAGAAGE